MKQLPILTNRDGGCPFGLNITSGCFTVGESINEMTLLADGETDDDRKRILNENIEIWRKVKQEPKRCIHATKIMSDQRAVMCGFEEFGVAPDIKGSPAYARVLNDYALSGTTTTPQGYTVDNNTSRNLYYGIYSLNEEQSSALTKLAENSPNKMGACVALICPEDKTLFLMLRSDKPEWGLPGGHLEEGEFPGEGMVRETIEEAGSFPNGTIIETERHENDWGVTYLFFMTMTLAQKEAWEPKINFEHVECGWFDIDQLPDRLHISAQMAVNNEV